MIFDDDSAETASPRQRRVAQARAKKEEGNVAFRLGDFRKASFFYKQAGMLLRDLISKTECGVRANEEEALVSMLKKRVVEEPLPKPLQDSIDEMFAATQSNLAAAHLQLGRFKEAEACAGEALLHYEGKLQGTPSGVVMEPGHQRAYFRRAQARTHLGEWELAKKDLALLNPADPAVAAQLQVIDSLVSKNRDREKKIYANLFS